MSNPYDPIDLTPVKTHALAKRNRLVSTKDFATPWNAPKRGIGDFLDSLSDILAGSDIKAVVSAIATAFHHHKKVVLGMGAHVIKVGLSPIVIDLMQRGILTAVAVNGAGIIHDLELALTGGTSEDVAASIADGSFGMARETSDLLCEAIASTGPNAIGLGQAVGRLILARNLAFKDKSILASGAQLGIPVTVHVAMGTDILHMHPGFNPALAGASSHMDFRILAATVAKLEGGVYLNAGSAVILPEVFLKAVSLVRNLGHRLNDFTTVNLDFIRHYRPMTNVVARPTAEGGRGYNLVGHHEIMLPLIAAGVIETIGKYPAACGI